MQTFLLSAMALWYAKMGIDFFGWGRFVAAALSCALALAFAYTAVMVA